MNLLYDFVSSQDSVNGGSEYCIRVFNALKSCPDEVDFYCLFDRDRVIAFPDFGPEALLSQGSHIHIVWYDAPLAEIVSRYHIGRVYLAIGQRFWQDESLGDILCPVYITIHDAGLLETVDSHLYEYLQSYHPNRNIGFLMKQWLKKYVSRPPRDLEDRVFASHLREVKNLHIIAVSEYTRNAILCYFGLPHPQIDVFWSPEKITVCYEHIANDVLREMIESKQRYVLMVNANKGLKNPEKGLTAFCRYKKLYPSDIKIVTVGYQGFCVSEEQVALPFLSESDLENAYKYAWAFLYPSLFEGFGYPPVEAMKYGTPVLSANVTSMPEVLGNAAIWFSPFYIADMVRALHILDSNIIYSEYKTRSINRYNEVRRRQEEDLSKACELILHS